MKFGNRSATMRLALVQMRSVTDDRDANVAQAATYIDQAAGDGADLIVLPEFFNHEYVFQYRDYDYLACAELESGHTITAMREKAIEHRTAICATIFEEEGPGLYFDTAFFIAPDGAILAKYRKTHPAAVASLEKIYFRGGVDFPVIDINGFRVGVNICYDHSFPEAARCAAVNGAELIVGPFAAPYHHPWEQLMITRAWENSVYLAPCNKVGQEGDWVFGGRSMIVDPFGKVVSTASSEVDETIVADLSLDHVYQARRESPMLRDRRPEAYFPLTADDERARNLFVQASGSVSNSVSVTG